MRDCFRAIFAIFVFIAAFIVGFQYGRTKEKAKIPNFQEDTEGNY